MQKRLDEFVKNNVLQNSNVVKKDISNKTMDAEQFYHRFRHCI